MIKEQSNVTQPLIPSPGTEDVESDYSDFNELDFTDITPTCEQGAIGTVPEAATNAATFNDNDLPPGWEQKLTKTPGNAPTTPTTTHRRRPGQTHADSGTRQKQRWTIRKTSKTNWREKSSWRALSLLTRRGGYGKAGGIDERGT
jgi:hypothetical protein